VPDVGLTLAIRAELKNKQKEAGAQGQEDEETVYMKRILG
jgi:hypothetical protein